MAKKTLLEEHREEYDKLLKEEFEKGKESLETEDEKLEKEILEEGIKEEDEVLDEKETADEKLEKEILEEDNLEEILESDALYEKKIREKRINTFLMNQDYDASLSDRGIQPIINLEEDLEEETEIEGLGDKEDFGYKVLDDENDDPYKAAVAQYEPNARSPGAPPELRDTAEQALEKQSKLYNQDTARKESDGKKFIEFKEPKRTGYNEKAYKPCR